MSRIFKGIVLLKDRRERIETKRTAKKRCFEEEARLALFVEDVRICCLVIFSSRKRMSHFLATGVLIDSKRLFSSVTNYILSRY